MVMVDDDSEYENDDDEDDYDGDGDDIQRQGVRLVIHNRLGAAAATAPPSFLYQPALYVLSSS